MSPSQRIWFITGASRGFGREIALQALSRGDVVIGTSRNGQLDVNLSGDRFHALALDVSDSGSVQATVERARGLHGRLDVVVNNAGYGLLGAVEEADESQLRRLFDVNFFGTWNVIRAVLPAMRARRSGHIVNFSSIAGLVTQPGTGLYAASKFAIEGLSQTLAQELEPLGIGVTIVEPGSFRTEFLSSASLQVAANRIEDYSQSAHPIVERLGGLSGRQPGDPVRAAQVIVEAVCSANPPQQLLLGSDAYQKMRTKQQQVAESLERWREITLSTDFQRD